MGFTDPLEIGLWWPHLTTAQAAALRQARYDALLWVEWRASRSNLPPRQLWHEWRARGGRGRVVLYRDPVVFPEELRRGC